MSNCSGSAKPVFTILTVVLGFVVHGAQAAASCGDYLHTVHSRPAQHGMTDDAGQPNTSGAVPRHETSRPPVPCSGPECGRHDGPVHPPLIPTTGGVSPVSEALLNSVPHLEAPTGRIPLAAESAEPRRGFPRLPKKPPRSERASTPF